MKNKCQFCSKEYENKKLYYGYSAMIMPNPEIEKIKGKWGKEWWKFLEQTDLTENEHSELEKLSFYDQLLNTVGKGFICHSCLKKEDKLLEKYYN